MDNLFIILAIIVAVLLILIVLVQNSKGGGLSSQFGGSGAQQVIGVKKTTDLLEKVTWGFAIGLLALSLVSTMSLSNGDNDFSDSTLDNLPGTQQGVGTTALPTEGTITPVETDTTK